MSTPLTKVSVMDARASTTTGVNLLSVRFAIVAAFALATALSAQVIIPLPGTPVPITLQTLVVLSAALCLGAGYGMLSMGLYLMLGTVGYEFFHGGSWGLKTLIGPTGGYLIGFLVAQAVVARIAWRRPTATRMALGLLAGYLVIFSLGVIWLQLWLGQGWSVALAQGFLPFIPGMLIKAPAALGVGLALGPRIRPWFA